MVAKRVRLKDIERIRLRRDEDGCLIGRAVRKRFKKDHVFEDQGRGLKGQTRFGVYWDRSTPRSASVALKVYRGWVFENSGRVVHEQIGDRDGLLIWEGAPDVPEWFKKPAGKVARGKA